MDQTVMIAQLLARVAALEELISNKAARPAAPTPSGWIFLARLISVDAATGQYTWKELDTHVDGTLAIKDGGRQGELSTSATLPFPAFELSGNKSLPTGETTGANVWLHKSTDPATGETTYRFAFPGAQLRYAKLTATWGYGDNFLTANPCDWDGNNVDTGTSLNLNLQWPLTEQPQYFPSPSGAVVPYLAHSAAVEWGTPVAGQIFGWRQIPICSQRFMVLQGTGSVLSTAVTGLVFDWVRAK